MVARSVLIHQRDGEVTATPELFSGDPQNAHSRKRPPSSPAKDDPAAKKASHTTRQPTASTAHPLQPSDDNSPRESPFLKTFLQAIKKTGPERSKLMGAMSGRTYFKCCSLFLQYTYGNYSHADLKTLSSKHLNDKNWTRGPLFIVPRVPKRTGI